MVSVSIEFTDKSESVPLTGSIQLSDRRPSTTFCDNTSWSSVPLSISTEKGEKEKAEHGIHEPSFLSWIFTRSLMSKLRQIRKTSPGSEGPVFQSWAAVC